MNLNYKLKDALVNRLLIFLALLATIRQFKRFLWLFIRDMKAANIVEKYANCARLRVMHFFCNCHSPFKIQKEYLTVAGLSLLEYL